MRIEWVSPDMERIVPRDEEMEELGSGYNGAEGPVWWKESGHLLFSDIANDRRMKWAPGEGASVFLEPTNKANGLTRDPQGRLIACEQATRRVTRLEPDGNITVVVDGYQGKRLNCPNDVVVRSDGTIYFSDPGIGWIPSPELDFAGVYRVSPDLSTATVVVRDLVVPNGLAFSPDESILYIVDSRPGHIRAFDVQADGTLANDRLFFSGFSRDRRSVPDGIKVDVELRGSRRSVWSLSWESRRWVSSALRGSRRSVWSLSWESRRWVRPVLRESRCWVSSVLRGSKRSVWSLSWESRRWVRPVLRESRCWVSSVLRGSKRLVWSLSWESRRRLKPVLRGSKRLVWSLSWESRRRLKPVLRGSRRSVWSLSWESRRWVRPVLRESRCWVSSVLREFRRSVWSSSWEFRRWLRSVLRGSRRSVWSSLW